MQGISLCVFLLGFLYKTQAVLMDFIPLLFLFSTFLKFSKKYIQNIVFVHTLEIFICYNNRRSIYELNFTL